MKKLTVLLLFSVQISFGNTVFWAKTGHRVTGEVAEKHLSGKAKRAIKKLLDGESLALVSTFADEIKADRSFAKFSAWHYVNFPADKKYTEVEPSEYGDVVMGIEKCIAIVKDDTSSKADKVFYLKMLVHLMGDLHQPMHVGRAADKGGNDIQIQWFGKGTNLHRLWDQDLIDSYGMSYSELTDNLPKLSKDEQKAVQQGTVYDWVEESQELANELYGSLEVGEQLGYPYAYKYTNTVRDQLLKGGLRLAMVLNDIFK
ncbi:S1/P1 nuclease [Flavobacteriaceae bacterium 3-367]|uniref:S1/P1 nuclease n=1 Tax=Eudoraea algarum TaxID=3417568 RepID=UPI00329247B9